MKVKALLAFIFLINGLVLMYFDNSYEITATTIISLISLAVSCFFAILAALQNNREREKLKKDKFKFD